MLHGTRITSDESAFDFARPKTAVAGDVGSDGLVTVPDAHLLFNGDFQRSGPDLKIVGEDGNSFLIPDYFKAEKRPTLLSPEGAALTPDVVEALAGPLAPGQYAQAGAQTSDQPAIGRVEQVEGNATIVRNGVAIVANQGDVVRKGDVVQTGGDGKIAVLFADGSTFSLSASARMVLNDFVYQAGGANNSALISLVQGTIGFVAGQVAKTGDMRVDTPVATMGIRGTAVLVEISANNGQTKFSVLVEPNGTTGSFNLYDKSSGALLGTVNNSTIGWVVTPAGPLQVIAQQVQKTPGEVQQELNYFQSIFNIFNQGQQNPFVPEQRTDNPNPQNTNGTGTQFTVNQPNGNPTNPGNGNQSDPIIVTVTPVNTGNQGPNDNTGPNNNNLPDQLPENFPLPAGTTFVGTAGNDTLTGTSGNDFIFAGAGDDTIIAGHGGGDDFYDGEEGFDTIKFPSANQSIRFDLNLEWRDGKLVSTAFNPGETGADVFVDIEEVIGGQGNDVFVLHDDFEWQIDGGAGVDIVRFAGNLSIRDYQSGGPEITNFEIIDLNDGVGAAFANEVDFDFHGTSENTADNYIRVIGGENDTINLIDASAEYPDGHWVKQNPFRLSEVGGEVSGYEWPGFGDDLTLDVDFDVWIYMSGGDDVFWMYVDSDIDVNTIENVEAIVHTEDGYNLSTAYDDLAGLGLTELEIENGTITGDSDGKRFVFSVENVGIGEDFPDLSNARISNITVYDFADNIQGDMLLTLTGLDIPLLDLDDALAAYVKSEYEDTSALDAIFGNATYEIMGYSGNDVLTGGHYRDVIDGGAGDDELTGGLHADTFVYNGGGDTIIDFSIASGDRIDLSAFGTLHAMNDIGPRARQEGLDTVIDFGEAGTLTLKNVLLNKLSDNDFIFNPRPVVEAGSDEPGISASTTSLILSEPDGDQLTVDTSGWATAGNGDHFYQFVSQPGGSWTAARTAAFALGGYLANITSGEENNFIFNNITAYMTGSETTSHHSAWIGATDGTVEGAWIWADGPEANQLFWQGVGPQQGGTAVNNAYNAWWQQNGGIEPNDVGGVEDYAYIDHNGVWTDLPNTGNSNSGYVVEYSGLGVMGGFLKSGTYGYLHLSIDGKLTYLLNNNDAQTQALTAGQTVFDNFSVTLHDGNVTTTQHVQFKVIGANDAPAIVTDNAIAESLGQSESDGTELSGLSVLDVDAGNNLVQVTITAGHGTLQLDDSDMPADSTLSLAGLESQINTALDKGVIYIPLDQDPETEQIELPESDIVTMTVTDAHGGTDTVNFVFTVDPVVDPEFGVSLTGTSEKDMIYATGWDDTLSGGAGTNDGNDTFVFDLDNNGIGQDTITDFTQGEDKIALYGIYDDYEDMVASGAFTNINLDPNQIDLGDGNSITLNGVQVSTLTASDFIIHPGGSA